MKNDLDVFLRRNLKAIMILCVLVILLQVGVIVLLRGMYSNRLEIESLRQYLDGRINAVEERINLLDNVDGC